MRRRIAQMSMLLVAAAGCDDGISPASVAWAWAGIQNTCVTSYDRYLRCWGSNVGARVGDGSLLDRNVPVRPAGDVRDVSFMSFGGDVCAVAHGGLICWGASAGGDGSIIGQGAADTPRPQAVISDPITQVAGGAGSRCVLKADGSVWCWGYDYDYSLGTGTGEDSAVPLPLSSLASGVAAIHATYAIKAGSLWGWGLINNSLVGTLPEPALIIAPDPTSGAGIIGVAGTGDWTCALRSDSRVWCWVPFNPNGFGLTPMDGPTEIDVGAAAAPILEIAVGARSLCRLDGTGAVQCAGGNVHGQLGDGTTSDRYTMAPVVGLPGRAIHVVAGDEHVCALLEEDRTLWCWGANAGGQLGVGDTSDRLRPTLVGF